MEKEIGLNNILRFYKEENMSKGNKSKKEVQYHVSHKFSNQYQISMQEIQEIFLKYYMNEKKFDRTAL